MMTLQSRSATSTGGRSIKRQFCSRIRSFGLHSMQSEFLFRPDAGCIEDIHTAICSTTRRPIRGAAERLLSLQFGILLSKECALVVLLEMCSPRSATAPRIATADSR